MVPSNIQIYDFQDNAVRIMIIDGVIWFHAKDVTDVLKYTTSAKAIREHVSELNAKTVCLGNRGRAPLFINESGLYELILGSKQEKAVKFKNWVTSEVLPSIRATGSYSFPQLGNENTPELEQKYSKRVKGYHKQGKSQEFIDSRLPGIEEQKSFVKKLENHGVRSVPQKALIAETLNVNIVGADSVEIKFNRGNGKQTQQTRDLLTPTELDVIKLSQRLSSENIESNDVNSYFDCLDTVHNVSSILSDAMNRAKNYRITKKFSSN